MEPASIRTMNPGAMWGRTGPKPTAFFATAAGPYGVETNAPIPLKWGSVQTIYLSDGLGQGNNIAIFPTWVQGICAQLDLWRTSTHYKDKRFADAIATWSGGNNVASYIAFCKQRVPGLTEDTIMNDAFWRGPSGVAFLKAQAWHEAGKQYPAPDADWIEAQRQVFDAAPPSVISTIPKKLPGSILKYVQAHGVIARGAYHSEIVGQIQAALLRDGRELVPDGDYGHITETAVRKFQSDHNLHHDGVVGPNTAAKLDTVPETQASISAPLPSVLKTAPWLSEMRAMNGLHEGVGGIDNPVILTWPREIANKFPDIGPNILWYKHDSIPWCGLAAAICVTRAGEKPPLAPLGAGNWASFGQGISLSQRCPGAIFVYSRVGGHHVTMYESEDATYYYCRGGNQSDQVCVESIPKSRAIIAVRWGIHFPVPTTGPVHGATANSVVANEA